MLKIAIVHQNDEYRKRLLAAIDFAERPDYEFHFYSSNLRLSDESALLPDIVFTDSPVCTKSEKSGNGTSEKNTPVTVLFSDGVSAGPGAGYTVPLYASINVIEDIIGCIEREQSVNTNMGKIGEITVVTSPFGGVGTGMIAGSFARSLALKGKKVLKISMDPFESLCSDVSTSSHTLSDILFGIKTVSTSEDTISRINSYYSRDSYGVCFIKGYPDPRDSVGITPADAELLSSSLKNSGFDSIMIDYPFGINETDLSVLSHSDRIVTVVSGEDSAGQKLEKISLLLRTLLGKQCPEICRVINRSRKVTFSVSEPDTVRIPYFEGINTEGIVCEICRMGVLEKWI